MQGIVSGYDTMKLEDLQKAIKEYKVTLKIASGVRMDYTKYVDEVKRQCMPFENFWATDTNPTYLSMQARELTLRQQAIDGTAAANDKLAESAAFKTHLITEFQNLACDYRDKLAYIAHQARVVCLQAKTPPDMVQKAIDAAIASMQVCAPRDMVRFERKHLSDAEAQKIYDSLSKPDYEFIWNDSVATLNRSFEMYANDLANADAVVVAVKNDFEETKKEQHVQDVAQTQAAELYVKATTDLLKVEPGVKPVTESLRITRTGYEKDIEWALKIMAAFMANVGVCAPKIRAKTFTAMTVDQMCSALDAANIRVAGIQYETFTK